MNRKSTLLALCLFLAASSVVGQTGQTGSFEEALTRAKAEGKPLLVDFYTETG